MTRVGVKDVERVNPGKSVWGSSSKGKLFEAKGMDAIYNIPSFSE